MIGSVEKGKRYELYVFQKLIEKGALPFIPIADVYGVDAVVRKADGSYVEIQVKGTEKPEQRGWFNVPDLAPRGAFFILGIEDDGKDLITWIFPSLVFAHYTTARRQLGLDSGIKKYGRTLRDELTFYRENWTQIT